MRRRLALGILPRHEAQVFTALKGSRTSDPHVTPSPESVVLPNPDPWAALVHRTTDCANKTKAHSILHSQLLGTHTAAVALMEMHATKQFLVRAIRMRESIVASGGLPSRPINGISPDAPDLLGREERGVRTQAMQESLYWEKEARLWEHFLASRLQVCDASALDPYDLHVEYREYLHDRMESLRLDPGAPRQGLFDSPRMLKKRIEILDVQIIDLRENRNATDGSAVTADFHSTPRTGAAPKRKGHALLDDEGSQNEHIAHVPPKRRVVHEQDPNS